MNETQLEELGLQWFRESGWQTAYGPEIAPDGEHPQREDYNSVLLENYLKEAIQRINPELPASAIDEALHKLKSIDHPIQVLQNKQFHSYLIDGIPIEVNRDGEREIGTVGFMDFNSVDKNQFLVVSRFTIQGSKQPRRPDLLIFINGIPLAVLELKNPDTKIRTSGRHLVKFKLIKSKFPICLPITSPML